MSLIKKSKSKSLDLEQSRTNSLTSLNKQQHVTIQTESKPKLPKVRIEQKVEFDLEKGPVVKIYKQTYKSINEEISNAITNIHKQRQREKELKRLREKQLKKLKKKKKLTGTDLNSVSTDSTFDQSEDQTDDQSIDLSTEKSDDIFQDEDDQVATDQLSNVNKVEKGSKLCRFCKLSEPESMIRPCDCKNANQWIHLKCLAKHMETTKDCKRCNNCKTNYKTEKLKINIKQKNCLDFFKHNRTNFVNLIELPLYLGFIFFLLALGVIQYEQSYKIIYLKFSIILVFLIIVIVLNHILLFISRVYQLIKKIRQFQTDHFTVSIVVKNE